MHYCALSLQKKNELEKLPLPYFSPLIAFISDYLSWLNWCTVARPGSPLDFARIGSFSEQTCQHQRWNLDDGDWVERHGIHFIDAKFANRSTFRTIISVCENHEMRVVFVCFGVK
jgi:hypothetical protein